MFSLGIKNTIPEIPLYASSIVNIKHKARTWSIAGAKFDLAHTKINSQIRVHAEYGAYNDMEKMWHVEFYVWSHFFRSEPFPFPFPSTALPLLISSNNPAPEPTGPRPTNSTPVANPYPPIYTPGPRIPEHFKQVSRSSLPVEVQHASRGLHRQSSADSLIIRGAAALNRGHASPVTDHPAFQGAAYMNRSSPLHGNSNADVGRLYNKNQRSLSDANASIGRAYNNRSSRGRASTGRGILLGTRPSLESRMGPTAGAANGVAGHGNSRSAGVGVAKRHRRTAVEAARRQMKISRRTGGMN
ncbi:unnamed protein product [Diplocarpon coronariae]|uniref:Uncharacterized protein n=1 Tax=Diplocarpon coronariae TaxID=2795749 RepID=A0A218ZB55_9HELO|nr:hypothetical protein B2J93_4102 [Marssonina coronariae]